MAAIHATMRHPLPFQISIFDHHVGVHLYTVRCHEYMTVTDTQNMVALLQQHLMTPILADRNDLRIWTVLYELSVFFGNRANVQLANHLTEWNMVLTMNVLGHMVHPNLTFTFIEDNITTDIHVPTEGAPLDDLQNHLAI